ncbi:hypothetical protein [Streptomyces fulvoviolaceus]|uniref:hypothetical protein n=1 Tax=Streptomyces fulvoviolaceus TaxID=285535 RepID=UPI0004C83983|nr:hypothetical protein [Streptomyces fulvoviolaceus]
MTSSSWDRTRRLAAAASVLTVITVVIGVLVLAVGVGVPEAWWPHTGWAFAADARPADSDACGLIVGPAKDYCEHGTTTTASAEQRSVAGAAWRLVPAGAGLAALVVWRRRSAPGRGRR